MILRRNFRLRKILPYVRVELALALAWSLGLWLAAAVAGTVLALPFAPVGIVGTALAIFLGFRNQSAYARWWEARTLWGAVVSHSRVLARLVVTSTRTAAETGKVDAAQAEALARVAVHRQIAFAHALRLHLRGQDEPQALAPLLSPEEHARVAAASNRPNLLLQLQGEHLRRGVGAGLLGQFDPISLEPNLAALTAAQAACERIKGTPLPRQYDFFTRAFLLVFALLLGPAVLGLFAGTTAAWVSVPVTTVVLVVFALVNRVGEVNESPFENRIQDVPLSALCNTIERDLREQLGELELPPPAQAVDEVLW